MDGVDLPLSSSGTMSGMRPPHPPMDDTSSTSYETIRVVFVMSSSDERPEMHLPTSTTVDKVKEMLQRTIKNMQEVSSAGNTKGSELTLISHGRVLGDKETLREVFGEVINSNTYHIHVVQRQTRHRIAAPTASSTQPTAHTGEQRAAASSSTSPSTLMLNPAYLAVSDSINLYRYLSSNALCEFLSAPTLAWDDVHPKPRVSFDLATDAVKEFLRVNELKPPSSSDEELEATAKSLLEEGVRQSVTGGECSLQLEVDDAPYKLVIPAPQELSIDQLRALGRFHAQTALIKQLQRLQSSAPMYIPMPSPAAVPTPTLPINGLPPHPRGNAGFEAVVAINIALPSVLILRVFHSFVMSACKVTLVLWMLTRHLGWTDRTFVGMASVALAWWFWDCISIVKHAREREATERAQVEALRRVRAEREAREAGQPQPPATDPAPGGGHRAQAAQPAARGAPGGGLGNLGLPRRRAQGRNRQQPIGAKFALFGLDYERRLLRLFYLDGRAASTVQSVTDHRIPSNDINLPTAPRETGLLWRWLIMPIYLFIISAAPAADAARKMAIRQREVHMRLLVQKLTKAAEEAAKANKERLASQESEDPRLDSASAEDTASAQPTVQQADPPHHPVLPRGLGKPAQRYYRRVLEKGETVDWEEEREAQAALMREAGGGGEPGEEIAFF